MQIEFDWDPAKAANKAAKHGVPFEDAMMVFEDPLALSFHDLDSAGEERWITVGEASIGNILLVVHTWTETDGDNVFVRVISARRPTRREIRQYREDSP